jgi:GlpG protein
MLFLGAAIVSSAAQLSVSGQTGIGMSGVLYAMFGFMWVARRRYPVFSAVVTQRIAAIFLVWLILCLALAKFADWQIGNAAHFGGLLFGALSGLAVVDGRRSAVPRVAAAALVLGSIASIFWCPWSFEWVASRAYAAHVREDYRAAVSWYRKCHRFDRQPVWVLQNLALAYAAMPDEEAAYSSTLDALREMSPEGVWEVEEEVARARSYCPAVDEPSR